VRGQIWNIGRNRRGGGKEDGREEEKINILIEYK